MRALHRAILYDVFFFYESSLFNDHSMKVKTKCSFSTADLLKLNPKYLQTIFSWTYSFQPGNTLGIAETERSRGKLRALLKSRSFGSRYPFYTPTECLGPFPGPDYCSAYINWLDARADAEAEARRNADPKEKPA